MGKESGCFMIAGDGIYLPESPRQTEMFVDVVRDGICLTAPLHYNFVDTRVAERCLEEILCISNINPRIIYESPSVEREIGYIDKECAEEDAELEDFYGQVLKRVFNLDAEDLSPLQKWQIETTKNQHFPERVSEQFMSFDDLASLIEQAITMANSDDIDYSRA